MTPKGLVVTGTEKAQPFKYQIVLVHGHPDKLVVLSFMSINHLTYALKTLTSGDY